MIVLVSSLLLTSYLTRGNVFSARKILTGLPAGAKLLSVELINNGAVVKFHFDSKPVDRVVEVTYEMLNHA